MIITAVSLDKVPFAVNVHPTPTNIAHHERFIRTNVAARIEQNDDFFRVAVGSDQQAFRLTPAEFEQGRV